MGGLVFGQEKIVFKPSNCDMSYEIRKAIENNTTDEIVLVFEKGTYYFSTAYALSKYSTITNHGNGLKKVAFRFDGFKKVLIEGNESKFVFSGQMAPFQFENCNAISVQNLTIDWDIPFYFQGEVIATNPDENWYELKPYSEGYSWKISKSQLLFPNINSFNYSSLGNSLAFNKAKKRVAYGALDMNLRTEHVEKTPTGSLRFYNREMRQIPKVGEVLLSKGPHSQNRYAPAYHVKNSSNVSFDNVIIHHALGMGFLFERTSDIKISNSGIYVEKESDRLVSTTADATHFANCKGNILIENSRFEHMLDDGTNVHGTYVEVNKILNSNTVRVGLMHFEQEGFEFAQSGDKIWFIKAPNPSRAEINRVVEVNVVNENFTDLTFAHPIPTDLKIGDILENKTWNPSFTIRNCVVKDHRARNIIIKTPKKIVIENNFFSSMMSSIMLRGESYYWFESGAVTDVTIKSNVFEYSVYGGAKNHAILKISPRLGKHFNDHLVYDKNIVFENNTIKTFNNPIVWADRVDGLKIYKNTIIQTKGKEPLSPNEPLFKLMNSTNVTISQNTYVGDVKNLFWLDEKSKETAIIHKNLMK